MRTFAAFRRLTGLSLAGLILTGTAFAGPALARGCRAEQACTAIAPAQVVSLTVAADYVGAVRTVHLKACQAGRCSEAALDLLPGSSPSIWVVNPARGMIVHVRQRHPRTAR